MIRARKLDVGLVIGSVSISKIGLVVFGRRQAHCRERILACPGSIRLPARRVVHDQEKLAVRAC
jgi:hypothetical protein